MNKEYNGASAVLWKELTEYEQEHEMTEDERCALREWVMNGNSVYENDSMAYTEHGRLCDFLDIYRQEKEIQCNLKRLSPKEQANYIARIRGEDTMDNLREDFHRLFLKTQIYEQILRKNGLLEEAESKIKETEERAKEQEEYFKKWRLMNPDTELPFD